MSATPVLGGEVEVEIPGNPAKGVRSGSMKGCFSSTSAYPLRGGGRERTQREDNFLKSHNMAELGFSMTLFECLPPYTVTFQGTFFTS